MRLPLAAVAAFLLVVACTSSPPPRVNYPPTTEPQVEIRGLYATNVEEAYQRLLYDYRTRGSLPPRDRELERACGGFPPPLPVNAPQHSQAALRAEQCGLLGASNRLRAEVDAGQVECSPLDTECGLRRARAQVERASGSRFTSKQPECAQFLLRYREWLSTSSDWGTCEAFGLFERLQLEVNSSWTEAEFRACLAPHVATFPSIARCLPDMLPEALPGEGISPNPSTQQLVSPQDPSVAAGELMDLLRSHAVRCSGFLGETRLAKADGIERWASLAASPRGASVRDSIVSRYGHGVLERALSEARAAVADFRSELCIARQ